jgi:D-alanyl-D-alanine carboxypeptidase
MKRIRTPKKLLIIIIAAVIVLLAGSVFAWTALRDEPDDARDDRTSHDHTDGAQQADDLPAPAEEQQPAPAAFSKSQYLLDQPTSIWVVANKLRPLQPNNYAPNDLVSVGGGQQMRSEAANAFIKLQSAASGAGHTISAQSGYRSYNTQVATYNRWVSELGKAEADRQSARPGHSEHQTGLALDVGGDGCNVEECFGSKPSGIWVAAHAHEYGFIIRYPNGKEHVTGYLYEPWHLRYVGTALATEMKRVGAQTMEEFFGLPAAPNYN